MKNFAVGQKYSELQMPDGAQLIAGDDGLTVFITLSGIKESEIKATKDGNFTYYLTLYNNVLFLSLDFGSISFDMGFNRGRMNASLPKIDVEDSASGYAMTIMVAEGTTGELKVLRLVGLSNKFSKRLFRALEEQEPISSRNEELQIIQAIQAEKTTKEIITESVVYGKSSRS